MTDRFGIAEKKGVKLYSLKQHLGKGYALRAGFAQANGDVIVTIDSDGSHMPEELSEVLGRSSVTKRTSSSAQDIKTIRKCQPAD